MDCSQVQTHGQQNILDLSSGANNEEAFVWLKRENNFQELNSINQIRNCQYCSTLYMCFILNDVPCIQTCKSTTKRLMQYGSKLINSDKLHIVLKIL